LEKNDTPDESSTFDYQDFTDSINVGFEERKTKDTKFKNETPVIFANDKLENTVWESIHHLSNEELDHNIISEKRSLMQDFTNILHKYAPKNNNDVLGYYDYLALCCELSGIFDNM
jgi:hypothetical protein